MMKSTTHLSHILLAGILFFLSPQTGFGEPEHSLDFITVEEGLSQSTVNALAQDNKGFLWIGTQDGLNYYDGHEFKVYKKDPFESNSLSDNHITALLLDENNGLWAGTMRGGLNRFDPAKQQFNRFTFNDNNDKSLSNNWVTTLHEDPQGYIWVGTTNGLNRFSALEDGGFEVHRYHLTDKNEKAEEKMQFISAIHRRSDAELLVGSRNGFYRISLDKKLNPVGSQWMKITTPENRYVKRINSFYQLSTGDWLIGTTSGLFRWDGQSTVFEHLDLPGLSGYDAHIEITKFIQKGDKELLIATVEGVFKFELNKAFSNGKQIYPSDPDSWDFQSPVILDLVEDKLHPGLLWLGTNISGLVKLYPRQVHFSTDHLYQVSRDHGVSPSVFHLLEDDEHQLWIGLEKGILIKNELTGQKQFYSRVRIADKLFNIPFPHCLYKDSDGTIWAGMYNSLLKLYLKNGELQGNFYASPDSYKNTSVLSIYEDGPYLYLGSTNSIFLFDRKEERFSDKPVYLKGIPQYHSPSKESQKQQAGFRITTMHRDRQDRLWVGCSNGVFLFPDLKNKQLSPTDEYLAHYYYQHPKRQNSLADNMVNQIVEDASGQIWIATMNGLAKAVFNQQDLHFINYYEKNGLANNVIYGILPEPHGEYLWLSTNNGLSRFHPQKQQFYNYKKRDGLQSSEFNSTAYCRTKDERLIFGGIKGYTAFRPEEVNLSTYKPPVWITSLTTFNGQRYHLLNGASNTPVVLDHSENSFAVHFTGMDFLHPTEVEYYYDLEGGTAKDVHIGRHRQIEFNQLAPGKYNLCVKAKGKDGAINQLGDNLEIHILTPYWQQSWFYWLCAGGILLISSLIYHTFYKIKMAQIAEIEQVRKAAAEDFHDELGSKLSIISMFSELTRAHLNTTDKQVVTYLDRITTTSGSLYESMRDMLWALNPEQDTVRDLFFQLKDFGEEIFSHTNTAFHSTGIQPGWSRQNLPMQYKRHVLLMCKEALHNSLRHANAQHVSLQMSYTSDRLKLEIKDDGQGCNLDQIERGEGLTNMETRARRINGTFGIISDKKGGTCITITCPLT